MTFGKHKLEVSNALLPCKVIVALHSVCFSATVDFESSLSRDSKSTRKRTKNDSKSTPWKGGSVVVGDESGLWAVAEKQCH